MAEKKNTKCWFPKEIDYGAGMTEHHKPNHLPGNITCNLWLYGRSVAEIKEFEINKSSKDMNEIIGTVVMGEVWADICLTSVYQIRLICLAEILNSREFRFIGEDLTVQNFHELIPGYPEYKQYPVIQGEKYEFFSRQNI